MARSRRHGSKKRAHSKKGARRHRRRTHRRGGKGHPSLAKSFMSNLGPVVKTGAVPGSLLLLNTLFKGKKRNGSRRSRRGRGRRSSRR